MTITKEPRARAATKPPATPPLGAYTGAKDFLQAGFVACTSKTNELQERSAPCP